MNAKVKIGIIIAVFCLISIVAYFMVHGFGKSEVVVYTSVDQIFSQPVLKAFEKETGIKVRVVYDTEETKSTGVLNRLIAEAKNPQADIFWSGDPVRPFLLINKGLVAPYISPTAKRIPDAFKSASGMWTGFAARSRILLVNKKKLGDATIPSSINDLVSPAWRGKSAIANPVFGTTTMHISALFSSLGENAANDFLNKLKENKVTIASSNGEVKRLVVAGEVTFGLTDTDDAFVAIKSGAPVEIVYPDQKTMGSLIMPSVVVLMKHGPNSKNAKKLIDYMLLAKVEDMLAKSGAHMPIGSGAMHLSQIKTATEIKSMNVDYHDVANWMKKIQPLLRQWSGI